MRQTFSWVSAAAFTALVLALGSWTGLAADEGQGAGLSDEEIVERILDLRRELDALLEALPADLREKVERRLAAAEGMVEAAREAETAAGMGGGGSGGTPLVLGRATPAPVAIDTGSEAVVEDFDPAEPSQTDGATEPSDGVCAELAPFDTNADGAISGFDRYWRLFRLWRDDGDGEVEPAEVVGLYDAGVREFSTAVRRYETVDGVVGDVRTVGGWITFERVGKKGRDAVLMIDADRLHRGGELTLVDSGGAPVAGLRRLGETSMLSSAGALVRLSCP